MLNFFVLIESFFFGVISVGDGSYFLCENGVACS